MSRFAPPHCGHSLSVRICTSTHSGAHDMAVTILGLMFILGFMAGLGAALLLLMWGFRE